MNEINEINEIKILEGVESISVTQHDNKVVIEFMPKKAEFKKGDFVYEDGRIMIINKFSEKSIIYHALICPKMDLDVVYNNLYASTVPLSSLSFRHATEDEKQLLIDALKNDGKRWNAEKLIVEDIPRPVEEPKNGDLAIFWGDNNLNPTIRLYHVKSYNGHSDNFGTIWGNAVKWDGTKEQFEKILRGEI